jgi:tetratricopeptide (TPR) repeat protein
MPRISNRNYNLLGWGLILLLGVLAYSNTFYYSFHFDDFRCIVNNLSIKDISNLKGLLGLPAGRFISFFTFALNYYFNGLDVFNYHLLNLVIHLGSTVLVWWLARLVFSAPAIENDELFKNSKLAALFTALVFLTHPLQTESVTYIWQRCTSLCGFFYLFSICLYVKSRLLQRKNYFISKWLTFYLLSLVFAAMSMFTKENSVTLPAAIVLCELCFFRPDKLSNWRYAIPFLFLLPIVPITLTLSQPVPVNTEGYYFLTQLRVIVTYIRLLFIPFNQNFSYDYPVISSLTSLPLLASFIFLAVIIFGAIRLFPKFRLISFGILWFFLTLSPDSSFIPLPDVIFEHRLYLPMVGFSFFLVSLICYFFKNKPTKIIMAMLLIIVLFNANLAFKRNFVWENEFTLWNDVVHKSPRKAKPYISRGIVYANEGNLVLAIADFTKAIALNPNYARAYYNRGIVYAKQGNFTQAISDFTQAIAFNPDYLEAYYNRGIVYAKQGNFTQAISEYTQVMIVDSSRAEAQCSLKDVHDIKADTYYNRGVIYAKQGNLTQAIYDFTQAIAFNPNYAEAYINRGFVYYLAKEYDKAWIDVYNVERLRYSVDPKFLGSLEKASGRHEGKVLAVE